jgi:Flp pilus assembly pilin Flp
MVLSRGGTVMHRLLDDSGGALVEYAVLISLIVAVAFAAVQAFGGTVLDLFRSAADVMP